MVAAKSRSKKKEEPLTNWREDLNLIDKIPVGVSVSTLEGEILEVNTSLLKVFGYDSKEEFVSRNAGLHWMNPKSDRRKFVKLIKKDKKVAFLRAPFKKKDGSVIWGSINAVLEYTENGPLVFTAYQDITDHKKAEESLQALADIVREMPAGLFIYQFEPPDRLVLLDGNRASEALTGIKLDDWRGKEFNEIWPEARERGVTEAFLNVMRTGEMLETEDLYYKDNRLEGAFNVRVFSIPENRMGVAFENITKRKQAEEDLRKSEQKARAILDQTFQFVGLLKTDGTLIEANQTALKFAGLDESEILGKPFWETSWWSHSPELQQRLRKAIKRASSGEFDRFDAYHFSADGTRHDVDCSIKPVFDEAGNVIFLIPEGYDVTDRKQAEMALKEKEAELSLKAKSLEDLVTTLRVLLKEREKDRADVEEKVLSNVKDLVLPYIERIKKTSLNSNQLSCIEILETNLEEIVSPFARKLSSRYLGLTPKEILVANLVKEGKTTKEIAEFMHLSPKTVEFHRDNIRDKLGIKKSKTNLRTCLLSM